MSTTPTPAPKPAFRDDIKVKMVAQQRHLIAGQTYIMPIGTAHGYVERAVAVVEQDYKKDFDEFDKLHKAAQKKK